MYLHAKFEISRIILTSFRQGVILPLSPSQSEPLKRPPRLGLNDMNFYQLRENFSNKYKKQLLDTGLDVLKTVVHKTAKATVEFIGNKIAGKIVKPRHVIDKNPRNVEEIITQPEKREEP